MPTTFTVAPTLSAPSTYRPFQAVIPVLSSLNFSLADCQSGHEDWETVDLGYGNILVLKKDICPAFHKAVEEAHFEVLGQLYQQWKSIVRNLLGKGI